MAASTTSPTRSDGRRLAEFGALGTAVYWGSSYLLNQRASEDLTPAAMTFFLFAACALLSAPFTFRAFRAARGGTEVATPPDRLGLIRSGAILGTCTGIGYLAHSVGLQYTSTSRVAFIIGMAALVVPIVEFVVFRKRTSRSVLAAIAVATLGLYLLTNAGTGFGVGDSIALITPVAYACWTVAASRFAHRYPVIALNGIGFAVTALIALPGVVVSGIGHMSWYAVGFIVGVGVTEVAITALCVWVAGRIEPARYGLLHLFEPVVAATIGFVVGEQIGVLGLVGALLILSALLLTEVFSADAPAPVEAPRFVRTDEERLAWEAHRYRLRRWSAGVVEPPTPAATPARKPAPTPVRA